MSLKTQIIADTSIYLNINEFAEPVTYTPKGGQAVNINMVIDRGANLTDEEEGPGVLDGALGYIGMADVIAVNYDDVINAIGPDGAAEIWMVRRIKSADCGVYEVVMIKDLRIT